MTVEEKLKELILSRYKSLRDFINSSDVGMPYTTLDGILKRGVVNASISNILKLCNTLDISADELSKGNIVPTNDSDPVMDYAKRLASLPPDLLESALMFIEYLEEKGGKR